MYPTIIQTHNAELEQRVHEFLQARGIVGVRFLHVRILAGVAVVRGRLPSAQQRQLCLECCRHVAGVTQVIDRLKIPRAAKRTPPTAALDSQEKTAFYG